VVFEDRAILLSIENIGIITAYVDALRAAVAQALKLTPEQVMLLVTHTHSGPDVEGDHPLSKAYRETLTARLVEAARQATQAVQPCTVGWGVTPAAIGMNRRERTADGQVRHGINPAGVTDDRIGVLAIHQQDTDERVGLLVICTAHGTVLRGDNLLISGDFPGWTQRVLSETLGCPVVVIIGAAGDCNPRWRGTVADLECMAQTIHEAVMDVLPQIEPGPVRDFHLESRPVTIHLEDVPEPVITVRMAEEAATAWEAETDGWRREMDLRYAQGNRQLALDIDMQMLRINGGALIGLPMEPFAQIALSLAAQTGNDTCFLLGYTNGYYGYLPTADEIPLGGYEVQWMPVVYGLETGFLMPVQPDAAQRVLDTALALYHSAQRPGIGSAK
jgi:hypothetical protein